MANELVEFLLDATLFLSATLLTVMMLRRVWLRWFGAGNALLLWTLVPVALVAVLLPAPVQTIDPAVAPTVPAAGSAAAPFLPAVRDRIGRAVPTIDMNDTAPAAARPDPLAGPLPQVSIAVTWLLGALLMTAVLVVRQMRLLRSLGRLTRRQDGTFLSEQPDTGPLLIGALRPRIVLPADFEQRYTRRQQDLIVAHERCHLRRGDVQFTLLACVLRCVFWFNPLVHLGWPRFRTDQELACDAAVLRAHPSHRRAYAEAMLATRSGSLALPVGCTWRTGHPLKTRIRMICAQPVGRLRLIAGTAMVLLAGSAVAVATWSQQEPQRYYRMATLPELRMNVAAAEPAMPTPGRDRIVAPRTAPMPSYAVSTRPPPLPEPEPSSPVAPMADIPEPSADRVADLGGAESGVPEAESVAVEHARLIQTTPPEFPRSMYRPRLLSYPGMPNDELPGKDGSPVGRLWVLLLRVTLDERGSPVEIAVDDSSIDDPGLVERYHALAMEAVRDWRFAPARIDEEPVVSEVLLPFYFDTNRYNIRPISYEAIATPRFRPGPPSIGSVSRYIDR
ncbi:hypothetical protein HFP89_06470 [Wenzhouxiangella sp. XN79A]|uniref:M56 family metallopeptidase n=1 Tax=Wenzhouxiangella sp. XN79A TaxID=2724193 RepID=UPI00144AD168|nr:M56 family metallopeptidase [Wenzhouxiangella sp. XN79A]NKI34807.1 hypothetical protein [Wenzhouxiangella sp. XN79A]